MAYAQAQFSDSSYRLIEIFCRANDLRLPSNLRPDNPAEICDLLHYRTLLRLVSRLLPERRNALAHFGRYPRTLKVPADLESQNSVVNSTQPPTRGVDAHCHADRFLSKCGKNTMEQAIALAPPTDYVLLSCVSNYCFPEEWPRLESNGFAFEGRNLVRTIGIHPSRASSYRDADVEHLKRLIRSPSCVGVGEIGLDFYRCTNVDGQLRQKSLFVRLVSVAVQAGKPIVLHCREAHAQTLHLVKRYMRPGTHKIHIHCFSAGLSELRDWLSFPGAVIGIGPTLLPSPNGKRLLRPAREVLAAIPLDRLVLESDSPFLPVGGESPDFSPTTISQVAKKVAQAKGVSWSEVMNISAQNALNFYSY